MLFLLLLNVFSCFIIVSEMPPWNTNISPSIKKKGKTELTWLKIKILNDKDLALLYAVWCVWKT